MPAELGKRAHDVGRTEVPQEGAEHHDAGEEEEEADHAGPWPAAFYMHGGRRRGMLRARMRQTAEGEAELLG